jgi:hypothetical protein
VRRRGAKEVLPAITAPEEEGFDLTRLRQLGDGG